MRNLLLTSLSCAALSVSVHGQSVEQEKEWIKEQCGCFSVTFDYSELFPTDTAYRLHAPYHAAAAREWVFVAEESNNTLVLQHLLIVMDTVVIKHWRQDWSYQATDLLTYRGDFQWIRRKLDENQVRGRWTQRVFQVDDSPRYEGSGSWTATPDGAFWESYTDAPLPRREFTKRSDYNVMGRRNRHEIHSTGWTHEQDNKKIIREAGKEDRVLVLEKGYNQYTRRADEDCALAQTWWKEHGDFWNMVRDEWNGYIAANPGLRQVRAEGLPKLWKELDELEKQSEGPSGEKTREEVAALIRKHYEAVPNLASGK